MTATLDETAAIRPSTSARFTIPDGYTPVRHREGDGHRLSPFAPVLMLAAVSSRASASGLPEPVRGDVLSARKSTSTDCFYADIPLFGSIIFEGSRLNPELQVGEYALTPEGRVLRVTSVTTGNLCIGIATASPDPAEVGTSVLASSWVHVTPDTPDTPELPGTVRVTASRLAGEIAEDGERELNPVPVDGMLYVTWEGAGGFEDAPAYHVVRWDAATESFWALYRVNYDPAARLAVPAGLGSYAHNHRLTVDGERKWVRADRPAAPVPLEVTSTEQSVAAILEQQARTSARREAYSERINELAEDNAWCSDFEEIVQGVGLPGRTKPRNDVSVDLRVEVTLHNDSPSGELDERIGADAGASMTLSSVEVTGTVDVTVQLSEVQITDSSDYSDVDELIERSEVEDAIDNQLSGFTVVSVDGWTVESFSID